MSRKTYMETNPPRGSQYINGELVHTATNQKLYHRLQVCTCFRETLKDRDTFSRAQAIKVMEKNFRKRQAHGYANLLEDRFTLEKSRPNGKEPFRTWLGYREITDIQRSTTKPEFFVLSILSAKTNRKYYEVYKCKSREDAQIFENTIKQAMADQDFIVRNGKPIDTVTVKDDPNRVRSMVHLEFQTSLESLEEDHRTSSMYQLTSPTPPEGYEYIEQYPQNSLPQPTYKAPPPSSPKIREPSPKIREPSPKIRAPSPRMRTPSPVAFQRAQPVMSSVKPTGTEGVTYIKFDPRTHDPLAADEGPVYMYMSRDSKTTSQDDSVTRMRNSTNAYSPQYNRDTYSRDQMNQQYAY
ncbi:unnamed protein product [Calicophoron daubneyi]|uniref:Trematode PH-like domain-containing protein n=1 Tax=Calicophoron daubneyi TaxID=300641 RepID=A0AAV2TJT9_CALDB